MSVGMVAFWFLVIIAIRALIPGVGDDRDDHGRGRPEMQDVLRVLDERLAGGELDVQEYRARREALCGPAEPMVITRTVSRVRPAPLP